MHSVAALDDATQRDCIMALAHLYGKYNTCECPAMPLKSARIEGFAGVSKTRHEPYVGTVGTGVVCDVIKDGDRMHGD
jgi:hypothetical protein